MMMKSIYVLPIVLILSGCGWLNRADAYLRSFSLLCVQGVTYVQFPTGASPLYTLDAKLVPCK